MAAEVTPELVDRLFREESGRAVATLIRQTGDFDTAETLFRKGFEVDPLNGENFRAFIMSHKTQAGDPVIETMLSRRISW